MAVDLAGFEQRRGGISDDYSAKQTANTFSRNLGQFNFKTDYDAFTRQFQRSYPKFAAGFGRRGMGNQYGQSGVYQKALSDLAGDHARGQGELQQRQFNNDQQFVNTAAQLDAARARALQDLEQQQAQEIAQAALAIQAVRGSLQQ